MLVAPGTLLTNAHVVWPFDRVRVVFPDGSAYDEVPVATQDSLADMAMLDLAVRGGPPPGVVPVTIADGRGLAIGSDLYLIGYPAEAEDFPQPALARGILSRVRPWAALDAAFLQTDADIAGGQSGGALVSAAGEVVGFSSMFLGDSDFALALSAPEAVDRLRRLAAGAGDLAPAPRPLPLSGGQPEQRAVLGEAGAEAVYVLNAPYGETVELSASSRRDLVLTVLGPYGDVALDADEHRRGEESGAVEILDEGPYFVVLGLDAAGEAALSASAPLARYEDPDDGRRVETGETLTALMDFPGDIDPFRLRLGAGQAVTVTVDTSNFLPDLAVEPPEGAAPLPAVNPRLAGPLGLTLSARLAAEEAGDYVLVIQDADGAGTGGYFLRVD